MKIIKKIILALGVFLVFVLVLEGILVLFQVGNPTQLLLTRQIDGKNYLTTNVQYMEKYFSAFTFTIPSPQRYLFPEKKGTGGYRIYVLGESTSQGFPYTMTESFVFQLEQMLNNAGLGLRFEVINLSMTATNSYTGTDMAKELINNPPDLVIVYYGHNEFIGIGGAGEYLSPFFQANLFFSHFRIYQVLKSIISGFFQKDERSIMELMAQKKGITLKSNVYEKTVRLFNENYHFILDTFRSRNIPVVACGVVANLKDFKPLRSEPVTTDIKTGLEELSARPVPDTGKMNTMAGENAEAQYTAGKLLLKRGMTDEAYSFLLRACDLDELKFRATSDIERIIREEAVKTGAVYVDFQKYFDSRDPEGISGNDILLEHVHPTLQSHNLIARRLAEIIGETVLKQKVPAEAFNVSPMYTLVDTMLSTNKMFRLYSTFPLSSIHYFNNTGFKDLYNIQNSEQNKDFVLKPSIAKDEFEFLKSNISYSESNLHVKFGIYLLTKKNDINRAYREFFIAAVQDPLNIPAYNNLGVYHFFFGNKMKSLEYLSYASRLGIKHVNSYKNYYLVLKKMGRMEEAELLEPTLRNMGVNPAAIVKVLFSDLE
ncbi:MAG: SGNH/GDSL hydrolase family protein [Spirochaetales bacterium]|nr:SGNH/GDSL hydrolase family protein [Spirochaetales bacterium]